MLVSMFRGVEDAIDPIEKGVVLEIAFLPSEPTEDKNEVGQSDGKDECYH